jgi:hypothetical protein
MPYAPIGINRKRKRSSRTHFITRHKPGTPNTQKPGHYTFAIVYIDDITSSEERTQHYAMKAYGGVDV